MTSVRSTASRPHVIDLASAHDPAQATIPTDTFLTAREVIARYGWGRTKGYRVLRSEGFPRPIGGDRYRLDTLLAWEEAQLSAPTTPAAPATLPPRKRVRSAS